MYLDIRVIAGICFCALTAFMASHSILDPEDDHNEFLLTSLEIALHDKMAK